MECDLHMHSSASDGTVPPAQLPALAREAGLAAIALTDHDTTAGLPACAAACAEAGIEFVPGIEISADAAGVRPAKPDPGQPLGTLHVLGMFVRHDAESLAAVHRRQVEARAQRNPQIVQNLQSLGVKIDYAEVLAMTESTGTRVVGRPHIAQVLVRKGYVKSVQDAFSRYIGEGKAAYARTDRLPPAQAIQAIHDGGGVAILAHPIQLKCADADDLAFIVRRLKDLGLDGIETRHSDHTARDVELYEKLARELDLLTSGGSDFHGARKSVDIGAVRVGRDVLDRLRATAQS